ncbi:MAG TPA: UxaA family hydrolase [Solirubrobacteraceae bacterium]|jgi:hypothetical protein|nr:UxaA family hydrolase [Solirubrobacteraceae bacterium]
MTSASDAPRALLLDPADNVAVAVVGLDAQEAVAVGDTRVPIAEAIRFGHKFALRPIPAGTPVRKYNEVIGIASRDIAAGEHVHVHNVVSARLPGPEEAR